ncbi:MAG TPA: hypothetical protein VFL07_13360, partial [Rudaea sp.]|nr:hypothetical protein [Rudaea sp.]
TPEGVDEMLMFSVVPRVTDAPPSMMPSAKTPTIRMKQNLPSPGAIKRNRCVKARGKHVQ